MPKIITFGTLKGGVGKTISAFNIAGILAEDYKVLVIDTDPQGNTTCNLGVDRTQPNFKGVTDIFESSESTFESIVIKSPISSLPNLDIIPSSIFLAGTELKIVNVAGRELILKNFLEDNDDYISNYDYIILDTNPSMSIINQNCFLIADSIILLSDVSMNALEGAELFLALWEDARKRLRVADNVRGLLINNLDKRIRLSSDIIDYCKDHEEFNKLMFKTVIPTNVKLKESELEARPVNLYSPNSPGHEAFKKVIQEMKERSII